MVRYRVRDQGSSTPITPKYLARASHTRSAARQTLTLALTGSSIAVVQHPPVRRMATMSLLARCFCSDCSNSPTASLRKGALG